jgi:hypothetical protein
VQWPRMTIGRWMVAVVIVGAVFGGLAALDHWLTWQRYCNSRAEKHHDAWTALYFMASTHGVAAGFRPYLSERYLRRAAYHAEMRRKWKRARAHPSEPVAPDPPEP